MFRKTYGKHQTQLLKCKSCGREFSETRGTPRWNSKLPLEKFVSVAEHIAEGHSPSSIVRTCKVHHDTIERIARVTGEHASAIHHIYAVDLKITAVQADERWGFAGTKKNQLWEATTLDPRSKFIISLHFGQRTQAMIRGLLEETVQRIIDPQGIVFYSDGLASYESLFPELFGVPFQASKSTHLGRRRAIKYKIPRSLAHVQVIKHRQGRKLETVEVRVAHGSQVRVTLENARLGYNIANTSAIERQNGSARESTMFLGRKGLSFARLPRSRVYAAEITRLAYNWVRTNRSLRVPLVEPIGRKRFEQRTPSMAIGITSRVWSWAELVVTPVWALAVRNHST